MSVLKNQRRELFCQAVSTGSTFSQAAKKAGYSKDHADKIGSRLHKDISIRERIVELQAKTVEKSLDLVTDRNIQAAKFVRQAVQDRQYRLTILQDVVDRIRLVFDERAESARLAGSTIPGETSGLLVRQVKAVGTGAQQRIVEEYAIDKAAMTELRKYLKQAAIETGEWEEQLAHRVQVDPAVHADLDSMTTEQLLAEQAILREAKAKIEAIRAPRQESLLIEAGTND